MSVVSSAKRTIQATLILAVLAYAGFYALTRTDTSKDRSATVIVTLAETKRRVVGSVYMYINSAERSSDTIDQESPKVSETFWVRPGEKVRVHAYLIIGRSTLTCQILLDGVVVAGPVKSVEGYEATCELFAVA